MNSVHRKGGEEETDHIKVRSDYYSGEVPYAMIRKALEQNGATRLI